MNALSQYIELYKANRETIDANAPAALNNKREAALALLEQMPRMPKQGDEGFEKISLNDMFAPDYGVNISRIAFPADAKAEFTCDVPNVGTLSAMLVNDRFEPCKGLETHLPDGVEVMSLARAAELYPEEFAKDVAPADNSVVALNTLLVQDGVFIRVRKGIILDKPVQILSLFNTSQPLMAARRMRIIIEDGASASVLVCNHPRVVGVNYLSCRVIEASVGKGASLNFYDLEEATERCNRASVFASEQHRDSQLNLVSITLNTGQTRNEYYIRHLDENCTTSLNGLVIAGGEQVVDNASFVTHDKCHCNSSQLFKYALFDNAQGAFEGLVKVEEDAFFTDAHQTNRNLLVSPTAQMHTMPQLIINCDEVKASHGATTGQLDEKALFYMRSRGIPEDEARMMLINAFMADVLDNIAHEPLRERLRHLVDRRLRGCATVCSSCSIESLRKS